ncbi:hypothetical protein QPK31_16170 [Massilia sp. YIM B02769]|uniref:hypothetical protein n=1 Tax=Massilia sp. YIM B02769 TaxID=3050129 RepID=UPI0025B6A0D5|nr:hypothetical protein [Massilia sp. YIM B02769]MDN4059762.1 hypothetical protein [Massilia sp. YIM B02769]
MSRALLYTILGCVLVPLNALAVWEYPALAQLALFDAVERRCGSFDPATFRREYEKMLVGFTEEERSALPTIRQSTDYRELLVEANNDLAKQIAAAGEGGEAIVCKRVIEEF